MTIVNPIPTNAVAVPLEAGKLPERTGAAYPVFRLQDRVLVGIYVSGRGFIGA